MQDAVSANMLETKLPLSGLGDLEATRGGDATALAEATHPVGMLLNATGTTTIWQDIAGGEHRDEERRARPLPLREPTRDEFELERMHGERDPGMETFIEAEPQVVGKEGDYPAVSLDSGQKLKPKIGDESDTSTPRRTDNNEERHGVDGHPDHWQVSDLADKH